MIGFDVRKMRLSLAALRKVRGDVIKAGDAGFRQKARYVLELAAKVSPQFTGDFASNWNLVVDGNMPVYKQWADKVKGSVVPVHKDDGSVTYRVHQRGDMEAITTSMSRALAQSKGITMKSNVHIVNATDLDTDGTHMIGPDSTTNLRAVNIIPGAVRIESYLRARVREMSK